MSCMPVSVEKHYRSISNSTQALAGQWASLIDVWLPSVIFLSLKEHKLM